MEGRWWVEVEKAPILPDLRAVPRIDNPGMYLTGLSQGQTSANNAVLPIASPRMSTDIHLSVSSLCLILRLPLQTFCWASSPALVPSSSPEMAQLPPQLQVGAREQITVHLDPKWCADHVW